MIINFPKGIPEVSELNKTLNESKLVSYLNIQPAENSKFVFRFNSVGEDQHQAVLSLLKEKFSPDLVEEKFYSIGPSIGNELKQKTWIAIVVAILGIIIYIAWSFRHVSKPIPSIYYGFIAIVALIHDMLVMLGAFSILGHIYGTEVNATYIAALLTILGYSVNDTIVIFDRIRENLRKYYVGNLEEIIEKSLYESIKRSINTSFTVLLVLLAIFLFGGETIRDFSLALIIGTISGSYSTIFLACPLLLLLNKYIHFRKSDRTA